MFFKKKNKIKLGNYSDEYSFSNRYKVPIKVNVSSTTIQDGQKHYADLVARNLARLGKAPNRANGLKYFDHIMSNTQPRIKEIQEFKAAGGCVVGTFCVQVPEEIIYAAGCIPIRLSCGFYDSVPVAEEIIPANTCPLARSSVGFPFLKINPFFDLCDVIIIPTTCDAKKKMAEVMSNYKQVWTLELPQNRDHLEARDLWLSQIEILVKKFERLTGKKVSREKIEHAVRLLQQRTMVTRELLELKKSSRIVISGADTMLAIQSAFNDDIHRWIRYMEILKKELLQNIQENKTIASQDAARIMMTGSPLIWPTWKVLDAIEDNDAVVVADDSCAGSQYFYNTVEVSDWSRTSMMAAIADKYLLPTICPIFIHSDDRVDRILEIFEQYKAQGVIYHVLRLCQLMDFEHNKVSHVLRDKKIPTLKIETEYGEEDSGQIKTRVEAFIEMMHARMEK